MLCNILAPVIKALAPELNRVISSKGHAFFSGLLVDQIEDITSVLVEHGWHLIAFYQQDNWALIHLCKDQNQQKDS